VADTLHIGADFLAALGEYTQAVHEAVQEASKLAMENIQNSLRESARLNERWKNVSDHIESWSQDGRLVVGIRNTEVMSEAMSAEYGDADNPPVPMFRNMKAATMEASEKMDSYLHSVFGTGSVL
jgi:hypothetical protein